MKLQYLEIRLIPSYASENTGQYKAEVQFEDKSGKVSLSLDPDVSGALLAYCGPLLSKFSAQASQKLENVIALSLEDSKRPEIPAQVESV